ncbi:hypothetical protein JCM10908_003758 [Rhodotorula pacifica]|uniref:SNG1 family protein n=1 Tax=Rhodotorula pacifica TaxID=1495444 RepID=UPI00317651EE
MAAASPEGRRSEGSTLHENSQGAKQQHDRDAISLWDPALKGERKAFIKSWAIGFLLTNVFMWGFLPVYWGSYFRQPQNLYRLTVGLIDLDTPGASAAGETAVLGPALLQAPSQLPGRNNLGFVQLDNTRFDISSATGGQQRGIDVHQWASDAVLNEDYFGVIIANANATVAALSAYQTVVGGGQANYMAEGALTMYYEEGRNFETVDQWVAPRMNSFLSNYVLGTAATSFLSLISNRIGGLSDAQLAAVNSTALASVISKPFAQATWNLRPISQFAGIPATSVGMLYLLIFTYFCSMFWNNARGSFESKIILRDLIILRVIVPVVIYFFISLWVSLVTLAFRVSFNQFHGKGGFPIFWGSNFLTMWALGMPMEIALSFLGPRYTAFFLIAWVILNVSVAFLDLADMDHFYSYGFVMPVYQAVQNGKAVIFGTKSRFGQYFGVLTAWVVCGTIGLILTIMFIRKRTIKKQEREREQKAHEKAHGKAQ